MILRKYWIERHRPAGFVSDGHGDASHLANRVGCNSDDPSQAVIRLRRSESVRRARRGAALVEVALTIPILMLVLAMIGSFSRAYIVAKAVDNAASQGALSASTTTVPSGNFTTWAAGIEQQVRQAMSVYSWYVPTNLAVQVTQPSVNNGLIDAAGNVMSEIHVTYHSQHLIRLPGQPASYTIQRTLRIDKIR